MSEKVVILGRPAWTVVIAAAVAVATLILTGNAMPRGTLFARQNLIAWCVIPFDSMHRTPLELAQMLKRLGIGRLGIDWRAKDIPHFDEEIDTLRKNQVIIQSFWLRENMSRTEGSPSWDGNLEVVLATLKRNHLRTQIWDPFDVDEEFMSLSSQRG